MTKESLHIDQRNVDNICCTFYLKGHMRKTCTGKSLGANVLLRLFG